MKILLSPAKKMNVNTDDLAPEGLPVFMEQTEEILQFLQGLSYGEAKKLWACNDRIAEQNYDRLKHMDLCHGMTGTARSTPLIRSIISGPSGSSCSCISMVWLTRRK